MKNPQVGFLSPSNDLDFMEYDEVLEFCRKICESDTNIDKFLEFKKDYSYFNPYFDFVMFELDYVMINGLCRNRCITKYKNALYEVLDSSDMFDYNYDELKSDYEDNYDEIPVMAKCSDSMLRIKPLNENIDSCIIDPKGNCMMSNNGTAEDRGSHAVTCRTILNQLLLGNKEILNDYLEYGHNAGNYLIENYGFLKATSKEEGGFIIGNSIVMPPELCQVVSSLPGFIFRDISKSQSYVFSSSSERRK